MTTSRSKQRRLKALWKYRPRDPRQLRTFVQAVLGLDVPSALASATQGAPASATRGEACFSTPGASAPGSVPVSAEGASPLDYLSHAFFDRGQDVVVWAPRGGGKTMLGAAATVLDLLFKPGIELRILGGSLEQSQRMYEHVLALLDRPLLRGLLRGEPTQRRVVTRTGARAAVLSQSQRSVRGLRVQKLRCDEVDMFGPDVWEAAQLVTRSADCAGQHVPGVIEALSTMHVPGGLMSRLVGEGTMADGGTGEMADGGWAMADGLLSNGRSGSWPATSSRPTGDTSFARDAAGCDPSAIRYPPSAIEESAISRPRLIRWTVLDVIERCGPDRPCAGCVLWDDCGGRAKHAAGFVSVDDLVRQWKRSSRLTWDSEMMCRLPAARERVFEEFAPRRHVREQITWPAAAPAATIAPIAENTCSPILVGTGKAKGRQNAFSLNAKWLMVGGMDFGWRNPTVFLWAIVRGRLDGGGDNLLVHVIDEYAQQRTRLEDHVAAIQGRGHGELAWVGIDPAGGAGNSQTGLSDAAVLRRHGFRVRARQATIREGVELVRRLLDHGQLFIHPRCTGLIEAMRTYHYDVRRPRREEPVKDGPDHFCDALRYLLTNLGLGGRLQRRDYLYGS
ncbi:MAG: hypothetical protein IT445_04055 [Phycisphaeraceae bacterium]|nr:hypothetical protein [Phycisphaeraceae bacterium]